METPIIYWFRLDLRTRDLPGLLAAAATGKPLVACYILDDASPGEHAMGSASRWWLHHSLTSLMKDSKLPFVLLKSEAEKAILKLVKDCSITHVVWNLRLEPEFLKRDKAIQKKLQASGIEVIVTNGAYLHYPAEIQSKSKDFFKVFTPFYKHCMKMV